MSPNETRACADGRCRGWIHIDGETRSTASSAQSRGRRTQISAQTMQRPCTLRPYPVLTGSAAWDWPWGSVLRQWRAVLSSPSRWRHQPLSEPEVSPERTQPQPRSEDRSRQCTINAKATPEDNRIRAGTGTEGCDRATRFCTSPFAIVPGPPSDHRVRVSDNLRRAIIENRTRTRRTRPREASVEDSVRCADDLLQKIDPKRG